MADAVKFFSGCIRMNSGRSMNFDLHAPPRIHAENGDARPRHHFAASALASKLAHRVFLWLLF